MTQKVMLTIRGQQNYIGQEPDVIELITEGCLEETENGWVIRYEESDLTGLQGVFTEFRIEDECIILRRTGAMNSQMVFRLGVPHDSLYQIEFGALMITVCASEIRYDITKQGGTVDLAYSIEIEQSAAGSIVYHLDIKA